MREELLISMAKVIVLGEHKIKQDYLTTNLFQNINIYIILDQ